MILAQALLAAAVLAGLTAAAAPARAEGARVWPANIIDGADDRGSLLQLGPELGLSPDEIARIRKVSGYVGCLSPAPPSLGSGALFLTDRQIVTAAHTLLDGNGRRRSNCFFRNQDRRPVRIDILMDRENLRFGGRPPRPGSNHDYAVARLAAPVAGAVPFPVDDGVPVVPGDRLIVVTAHPAGMEVEVDNGIPVVQPCTVRKAVPAGRNPTSFFRTDCDATGSSSGGMNLARIGGRLVFRGITVSSGPWQDKRFRGAPYDEAAGSATTALGTDAAILELGRALAAD